MYILWEPDILEKLIQKELEDEKIKLVNDVIKLVNNVIKLVIKLVNDVEVRLKKEDEEECL